MSDKLIPVIKQLKTQERLLSDAYQAAKTNASNQRAMLNKVRKAIATLDGSEVAGKATKQTVKTNDVVEILAELVSQNPLSVLDAKNEVTTILQASDKSLNGIALRFKQALLRFEVSDEIIHGILKNDNLVDSFGGT